MFRRDIKVQFNELKYSKPSEKGFQRMMRSYFPSAFKATLCLAATFLLSVTFIRRYRYSGVIYLLTLDV